MADILGYDVNGRPLRVGDRVVIIETDPLFSHLRGAHAVVSGGADPCNCRRPSVEFTLLEGNMVADVWCEHLRRLGDHQPSKYTFDTLLDTLKTGAPDNANA